MSSRTDLLHSLPRDALAIIDAVLWESDSPSITHPRAAASRFSSGIVRYIRLGPDESDGFPLLSGIRKTVELLLSLQHDDGTIDAGNIATPPDTGFVMETMGTALLALRNAFGDEMPAEELSTAVRCADVFMKRGAKALVTGGVHTPNHRWVVCSALALAWRLYGGSEYLARINDWLREAVDIDSDGQYSERSSGIYSAVSSCALLNIALLLDRPDLLDPVRRNLEATLYLYQPDGRIETVASRRQDQYGTAHRCWAYYTAFRVLAVLDHDRRFAEAARQLELAGADLGENSPLVHSAATFFAFPEMRSSLPESDGRDLPTDYSIYFRNSGLFRERDGDVVTTVFGGHDRWPEGQVTPEISGRSGNPTFLTFCCGETSVRWLRIVPRFFSIGYFRPKLTSYSASECTLTDSRTVGYFQPLPAGKCSPDGAYELSSGDGRFFSALSFGDRDVTNVQSAGVDITVHTGKDGCDVEITGRATTPIPVCLEIALDPESIVAGGEWTTRGLATVRRGVSEIRLQLHSNQRDPWLPGEFSYGDLDRIRRAAEREAHKEAPLPMLYVSFRAPGVMLLSLRGVAVP